MRRRFDFVFSKFSTTVGYNFKVQVESPDGESVSTVQLKNEVERLAVDLATAEVENLNTGVRNTVSLNEAKDKVASKFASNSNTLTTGNISTAARDRNPNPSSRHSYRTSLHDGIRFIPVAGQRPERFATLREPNSQSSNPHHRAARPRGSED